MTDTTLITEEESATLTGVSLSTLLRFADAGYLKVQQEKEGQRFFAKQELCRLFGVSESVQEEKQTTESASGRLTDAVEKVTIDKEAPQPVNEDTLGDLESDTDEEYLSLRSEDHDALEDESLAIEDDTLETSDSEQQPDEDDSYIDPLATPANEVIEDVLPDTDELFASDTNKTEKPIPEEGPGRHTLQRVIELQEQLLDEREEKIQALQEEVQWLRDRVERAEDKADRDQLLLLSETQAIARLITRDQKKSSFQTLLEWVGIAKREDPIAKGTAIEIHRKDSDNS